MNKELKYILRKYALELINQVEYLTDEERKVAEEWNRKINLEEYRKWKIANQRGHKITSFKIIKDFCKKEGIKLNIPQFPQEKYYEVEQAITEKIKQEYLLK